MKVVLQRVSHAQVKVDGAICGAIETGYLALVGITPTDCEETVRRMAKKVVELRVFDDENGKMNKSLTDVKGSVLSVSQFTLYADCRKGRRPSFTKAAKGEDAEPLYECFNSCIREWGIPVQTGIFGAEMKVELLNDGPITIVLDSAEIGG